MLLIIGNTILSGLFIYAIINHLIMWGFEPASFWWYYLTILFSLGVVITNVIVMTANFMRLFEWK